MKHYEEFAVHNVWNLVKSSATLRSYLPSDDMNLKKFPNREWFWGVALTEEPHWANKYVRKVLDNRMQEKPHDFSEKKVI